MTPLSAIRGYVETLGMRELHIDPPTRERYLDIVEEETHKLEAIIGDLLDLAGSRGAAIRIDCDAVLVDDLFRRVADRHRPSADASGASRSTTTAAGHAADLGGRRSARAGAAEPGRQRDPSHAGGRDGDAARGARRIGSRAHHRRRHRPGHSARAPPAHLRSVLQGGCARRTRCPAAGWVSRSCARSSMRHGGEITADNAPGGGAVFTLVLPGVDQSGRHAAHA